MRSNAVSPRALLAAATVLASISLVACGGSPSDENDSSDAPSAAEFPKPNGQSIQQALTAVGLTDQVVAAPAGAVFTPGEKQVRFGIFDVGGQQITDAQVAVYAQAPGSKEATGPYPARIESLHTDPQYVAKTTTDDPDSAKVVYVADVPLQETGTYLLGVVVKDSAGKESATPLLIPPDAQPKGNQIPGAVEVKDDTTIPNVGEKAPVIDTPTVDSVGGDIGSIDTRIPPDDMHKVNLADALGKKPVVLLFATPQLCQSRVCGPVVDVAAQVESQYKDDVDFIHMEIYAKNQPPKLRSQVTDFGLRTEPWLFVIDKDGVVSSRIEGAFSVGELEDAVKKVLPDASSS